MLEAVVSSPQDKKKSLSDLSSIAESSVST